MASQEGVNLPKQDADLGQTGVLGNRPGGLHRLARPRPLQSARHPGHGGRVLRYPVSYLNPWYASSGVRTYEIINDTSLRIGDYEALKGAAIDPYIAIRDAYVQYRYKKIEKKRLKLFSAPAPAPAESVK